MKMALNLHHTLNFEAHELTLETITILDQIICTRRQSRFQIIRNCNNKIGFNTTANKLYHMNNLLELKWLNLTFLQFKRLAKSLFLKYGKT